MPTLNRVSGVASAPQVLSGPAAETPAPAAPEAPASPKDGFDAAVDRLTPPINWDFVAHAAGPLGNAARGSSRKAFELWANAAMKMGKPLPPGLTAAQAQEAIRAAAKTIAVGKGPEAAARMAQLTLPGGPGEVTPAMKSYVSKLLTEGERGALARLRQVGTTADLGAEAVSRGGKLAAGPMAKLLRAEPEKVAEVLRDVGRMQAPFARSVLRLVPYVNWGLAGKDAVECQRVLRDPRSSRLKQTWAVATAALSTSAAVVGHNPALAPLSIALGGGSLLTSMLRDRA